MPPPAASKEGPAQTGTSTPTPTQTPQELPSNEYSWASTRESLLAVCPIFQNVECGVDCPAGWLDILIELGHELEGIEGLVVKQIKPKFGGLRVYTNLDGNTVVDALIGAAMDRSWRTCEVCGRDRSHQITSGTGYVTTRCPDHFPEELAQAVNGP